MKEKRGSRNAHNDYPKRTHNPFRAVSNKPLQQQQYTASKLTNCISSKSSKIKVENFFLVPVFIATISEWSSRLLAEFFEFSSEKSSRLFIKVLYWFSKILCEICRVLVQIFCFIVDEFVKISVIKFVLI